MNEDEYINLVRATCEVYFISGNLSEFELEYILREAFQAGQKNPLKEHHEPN